jgi:hypothetical protein
VTYGAITETTGTLCSALPNGVGMTCRLSSGQVVVWFGQFGHTLSKASINCVVDGVDGAEAAGHTEMAPPSRPRVTCSFLSAKGTLPASAQVTGR